MGGFHLKDTGEQTQKTIAYLKHLNVERILPSHCTDLPALSVFYDEFKIQQVKTGQEFQF
jgi:7,8-dihydropterin-6-yl-methyl-4-(beta-D-ribofuranosyl)aminobenzene 5'-phosphate synthase